MNHAACAIAATALLLDAGYFKAEFAYDPIKFGAGFAIQQQLP